MSLRSFALCLVAAAAVHATPAPNYTPGKVCKVLALSGGGDKGAYEAGVVYVEVVETVETLLRAYASLVWMATPAPPPLHTHTNACAPYAPTAHGHMCTSQYHGPRVCIRDLSRATGYLCSFRRLCPAVHPRSDTRPPPRAWLQTRSLASPLLPPPTSKTPSLHALHPFARSPTTRSSHTNTHTKPLHTNRTSIPPTPPHTPLPMRSNGLVNNLPAADVTWDVVTGISAGSINAAAIATYVRRREAEERVEESKT